jgi:hypothetical protein
VFEEGQGDWRAFADFRDAGYGEGFFRRGEVGRACVAWGVWEEEEAVEGDGEGYYAVDYWGGRRVSLLCCGWMYTGDSFGLLNNHLHPLMPCKPSMLLWIPVWMKPPIIVPARPDAVKMPERFPSSFSVYQEPSM